MALVAGDKLGPYEILAPIGAGGMGQVYRARDTRLDRDVAIKVLPEEVAQNPERLARFEREAKVLASLNHPNIAQIYGVEQNALIIEMVEGETLSGPLPVPTVLDYARQLADALEAAHEKRIVHRDLKPANIKVTPQGVIKVLDFGLALVAQGPAARSDASISPTLTLAATQMGVLMGTAAYMSPEQAAGKPVDRRADIWAFGVVVWEMLTGHPLFTGETVSHILAAVLTKDVDWTKLPPQTPFSLRTILRQCLARDLRRRLPNIGSARLTLEELMAGQFSEVAPAAARVRSGKTAWIVACLMFLVAAGIAAYHFTAQPPPPHTLRYTIPAPESSAMHSFALSPDGRSIAIAAALNGKQQLWLQSLDVLQSRPMPTTDDATYPFWSPDSRYIGFFAQGKLKKIAAAGGPSQSLCDATGARGGSWNRDGVILFSQSANSGQGIQRVDAAGGVSRDVTRTKGVFRYPAFLPDGRHFLYTDIRPSDVSGVYFSSLDGRQTRRLLPERSLAVFAPAAPGSHTGHLLFVRENNLMAEPFDGSNGETLGDAFPVAEGVSVSGANAGYAPVALSENGVLLYWTGEAAGGRTQAVWYDRKGNSLGPLGPAGETYGPAISPNQKMVAFMHAGGGNTEIWVRDLARATDARLTAGGRNFAPAWSPLG